jgi:hypothetical protein
VSAAQRPGEDGSRERKERHDHQQQSVQEQYDPVGGADVVEHHVVVDPDLADEEERQRVGQVGRPERGQAVEQVPVVGRGPDLQDEQCDGDGEDAVAEGDEAAGFAVDGRRRRRAGGAGGGRAGVGRAGVGWGVAGRGVGCRRPGWPRCGERAQAADQ